MAELYGKATGVSGGRGGSMHLAGFDVGFIGSNGIVGASVGIALGDAFAAHYRGEQRVAVGFFGDGGINTGSHVGIPQPGRCLATALYRRLREQPLRRGDPDGGGDRRRFDDPAGRGLWSNRP